MNDGNDLISWCIYAVEAMTYVRYLNGLSKTELALASSMHHVGEDVKEWAKEKIIELLEEASKIQNGFNQDDVDLFQLARSAAHQYARAMDPDGYQNIIALTQNVNGLKTEQTHLL